MLCTGSSFTTPLSGQQGYIITGTNTTDATSITSGTSIDLAIINLPYGVWLITGHLGYTTASSGNITTKIYWISSTTATLLNSNMAKTAHTMAIGSGISFVDTITRVVTVTNANTPYCLSAQITFTNAITTRSSNTNLYAVRIA